MSSRLVGFFFLVMAFIFIEPGYCVTSVETTVTALQGVDAQAPRELPAERVLIGLHIDHLSEVDDTARSFTAEFDLWLRFRGTFDPNELLLLNTLKPLVLDHPDEATEIDGEHFLLFHLSATFRFVTDQKDLIQRVRKLSIQLSQRNHSAVPVQLVPDLKGMGLDKVGASWSQILRDDEVLSSDTGWEMPSGELISKTVNGKPWLWKRPEPALVASITVQKVVVSPRSMVAGLIPTKFGNELAFEMLVLVVVLIAATWFGPAKIVPHRLLLLIQLLLGTLGFYLFESWVMATVAEHLTFNACRNLLILFGVLWWLVPAIWINSLLPPFLWEPLNQRTGHPVPAISRMIVKVIVYAFMLMLATYFVYGYSPSTVWAASGVMGIILGFALQNLILDVFAGIMLNIEQPFKILQWIRLESVGLGQQVGQVLEMNWRATRLWTRDNNIISVPNSIVSKAKITNFGQPTSASRLEFTIKLERSIPLAQARQLLKQGVQRAVEMGKVLANPQPDVVVMVTDNDASIRYKVQFYANLALVSESSALSDVVDGVMSCLAEYSEGAGDGAVNQSEAKPSLQRESVVSTATVSPKTSDSSRLSPDQVRLIQHTWSLVGPIADTAARMFYERLFHLDPSLKRLFQTEPSAQRMKLIAMLNVIVRGVGDLDRLIDTVQNLGMRHVNYGIQSEYYDTVGAALLWVLEQGLGKEWTPEVKEAWVTTYGILSSTMKSVIPNHS